MATVICVGGEALHTRHPLLKSAGFDVLTATNESASLAIGRLPGVDAVVLDTNCVISDLPKLATELKCMRPHLSPSSLYPTSGRTMCRNPVLFSTVSFHDWTAPRRCSPRSTN